MKTKMEISWIIAVLMLFLMAESLVSAQSKIQTDEYIPNRMMIDHFDDLLAKIKTIQQYPMGINEALCAGDEEWYKSQMHDLALSIMDAEKFLEENSITLKNVNLWDSYNAIKNSPECGVVNKAQPITDLSLTTVEKSAQYMGVYESETLCKCFDLASGKMKNTGHYKDGACRCYDY